MWGFFVCFLAVLYTACRILVSGPGIEPRLLHWEHGVLVTGPPGKSGIYNLSEVLNSNRASTVLGSYLGCLSSVLGSLCFNLSVRFSAEKKLKKGLSLFFSQIFPRVLFIFKFKVDSISRRFAATLSSFPDTKSQG